MRLLHAGPTLMAASMPQRFHITGSRKIISTVTDGCVTCRRVSGEPRLQLLGQIPRDRSNLGMVFDKEGVDYAEPKMVKSGPMITKAYMCIFMLFTVKAVHLGGVSELTTATVIVCLCRFIAQWMKPMKIWSDHGTTSWELPERWRTYTHTMRMPRYNLQTTNSVLIKAFNGALHQNMLHI